MGYGTSISNENIISVIVPAFNVANWISNCIESILMQSFDNLQIVIVDDGSTDETGKLVDSYALRYPDRIKAIHTINRGVTNARMTGVSEAEGNWIGFVDGDDEIERDMYERLLRNAIKYSSDISHCGYQICVNGGERIHKFYDTGKIVIQNRIDGLRDLIVGDYVEPSLCNKLFKRELFYVMMDKGKMMRDLHYQEDYLMNYLLFSESKRAVYEDFCPYHYIARKGSVSRMNLIGNSHRLLDPIRASAFILRDAQQDIKIIAMKRYLANCMNAYGAIGGTRNNIILQRKLKRVLLRGKKYWPYMRKVDVLRTKIMLLNPKLYRLLNMIYQKTLMNRRYE